MIARRNNDNGDILILFQNGESIIDALMNICREVMELSESENSKNDHQSNDNSQKSTSCNKTNFQKSKIKDDILIKNNGYINEPFKDSPINDINFLRNDPWRNIINNKPELNENDKSWNDDEDDYEDEDMNMSDLIEFILRQYAGHQKYNKKLIKKVRKDIEESNDNIMEQIDRCNANIHKLDEKFNMIISMLAGILNHVSFDKSDDSDKSDSDISNDETPKSSTKKSYKKKNPNPNE